MIYIFNRFKRWEGQRKISLPKAGEKELSNANQFRAEKRYRHNKMTAPDLESKSYLRKFQAGKYNNEEEKQDRPYKKGKSDHAERKDGAGGKSELKTTSQIVKERQLKTQRREKTGRPSKKSKRS